jgi:hypothetical protein
MSFQGSEAMKQIYVLWVGPTLPSECTLAKEELDVLSG